MARRSLVVLAVVASVAVTGAGVTGPSATAASDPFDYSFETGTGELALSIDGRVTERRTISIADDRRTRAAFTFGNVSTQRYWNRSNTALTRVESSNASFITQVAAEHNDSAVLNQSQTVVVLRESEPKPTAAVWFDNALASDYLAAPEYTRVGVETRGNREVVIYEPTAAFVSIGDDDRSTIRVFNVSGEVTVDLDTGRILSADVAWSWVEADSWGEYVIFRATGDAHRVRVTYSYEPTGSVRPVNTSA